jgi:hypothetical protein
MIRSTRGALLVWLAALALHAGCDKQRPLACGRSIADACAAQNACVLTWDEVSVGTAICARPAYALLRADCGGYHVLAVHAVDASLSYYYDATSGALTAIVFANGSTGTTTCTAGPAGGFTLPTCTGTVSEPLQQCLDGGADAIAGGDATATAD